MSKIKGIIFDLDDTLYNEIDYVKSGYRKVATYLEGLAGKTKEEIFHLLIDRFNNNRNNVFNDVLEKLGINGQEILKECLGIYRNQEPDIKLEPETKELLLELRKEYKLGIITDGRPEGQWAKIKALGLDEIMDEIIVTDELGGIEYRKPNPISYNIMRAKLDLKFNEMVYIGDNLTKDFIGAKSLNILTVQIENTRGMYLHIESNSEYEADYKISSLDSIKGICINENRR